MANDTPDLRHSVHASAVLFFALVYGAPAPARAALPEGVVPITAEPNHKIRFDNGAVRMIEAILPKGQKSLYHEHLYDGFYVFFQAKGFANEPYQAKRIVPDFPPGAVQFVPIKSQYIHRVVAAPDHPLHISVIELMTKTGNTPASTDERFPPFELALENPRGRAYRLKLSPGEETEFFTRPASTGIFAISSGRISEQMEGQPPRLWDIEPGYFRWVDTQQNLKIRNDGASPVELIEIEVH